MPKPIRVFHLIKSLGRGGAETLLVETLRSAERDAFTYGYGYLVPWKRALVDELRCAGSEVTCLATGRKVSLAFSAPRIARHVRSWGADILHCHLPVAGTLGRLAGLLAGVPVVYTEHSRMENYRPLTRRTALATWRLQRRVVAVSGAVAESIGRYTNSSVPVTVIRNGVDKCRFTRPGATDSVRRELGIPCDALVIGTVAGFRHAKRLDLWLEAAAAIRSAHPNVRFVLVGDGPLREEVMGNVQRLSLGDVTIFPGLLTEVRPWLACFDVFMMSSAVEGLPVALLEAMAMENAVLSTAVGGIPELVDHGRTGILVESGSAPALASAASELLHAPELRRAMGAAARQHVIEHFSIERMTRDIERVYAEVIAAARSE
jgi:L-malate glycosyltransferase